MYHFVKKFESPATSIRFDLRAEENPANILTVLNGKPYSINPTYFSGLTFNLTGNFVRGDVLECYVILPMIQPDRFTFDTKEDFISKALARVKRLEYGVYERNLIVEDFNLFHSVDEIADNTLDQRELIVVKKKNFNPTRGLDYSDQIRSYIANEIVHEDFVDLNNVKNGTFYVMTKHTKAWLNLIKLENGIITNSAFSNKILSVPKYDVYEFRGVLNGFNDYDWIGHAVIFFHGTAFPQNAERYKNRHYRITNTGTFRTQGQFIDTAANTTSPGIKSNFDYIPDSGATPARGITSYPIADVPGILSHTLTYNINFILRHGYITSKTDPITTNEEEIAGGPLPDFTIPVRSFTSSSYYGVELVTDNIPIEPAWPITKELNIISTDNLWERVVSTGSVRYVTKSPIFTNVDTAIPMTWRANA